MKKFLAIFLGTEDTMNSWHGLDEKSRQEREKQGMEAWGKWAEVNKRSILDLGAPLGKTKVANTKGISNTKNNMTAYTLVHAESHDAAANLFANHPHFTIFPGESIEIMECLEIPGM